MLRRMTRKADTPALRTSSSVLQQVLDELEQATLDHALWRDHLVRVIAGRESSNPQDLSPDAHHHCLFGRWYYERSPADLRQRPSELCALLRQARARMRAQQSRCDHGRAQLRGDDPRLARVACARPPTRA